MVAPFMATARTLGGALRKSDAIVESPETSVAAVFAARRQQWTVLESWADNRAYDENDWSYWADYKRTNNLPKWIRPVFNPVQRAVDWYAGHLYRGTWTEDGRSLPDGTPNLIPVPDDVWQARPLVVEAAFQALTWSNFRSVLPALIARTQLLGSQFVEIHDDLSGPAERRKVTAEVIPLWQVADIALNSRGDVKRYVLAYTTQDERGTYAFRKEVDNQTTRWYRDDKLERTDRHGYGFCPGVWVVSRLRGSRLFGVSLVASVLPKLDRINAIAAFVEARLARTLNEPRVFYGLDGKLQVITETRPTAPGGTAHIDATETGTRILHWNGENGRSDGLLGAMDFGGAEARMAAIKAEVESDLPEIVMDQELRGMSQVTGPGAEAMIGDVRARFDETMGNMDAANIKIMQMLVSIGCHRANSGAWDDDQGNLTRAQATFRINETVRVTGADGKVTWDPTSEPVGLDSFGRGAVDLAITKRALLDEIAPVEGSEEYERTRQMRLNVVTGLASLGALQMKLMGLKQDDIDALLAEQAARDAVAETIFNRGAVAP